MKRFDSWSEEVPCDTCELYYNSLCDSVKSSCNAYVPTLGKRLDVRMKRLEMSLGVFAVVNLILLVGFIIMIF